MNRSTNSFKQYQYLTNPPLDDDLDWDSDQVTQLYQIIQHLHCTPPTQDTETPSSLTKYIKYILGYHALNAQHPPLLGITDRAERYQQSRELPTMLNIPPCMFQTEPFSPFLRDGFGPHDDLQQQLDALRTYAIIINNPALLTWILYPDPNPKVMTWDDRIHLAQQEIDTLAGINSSLQEEQCDRELKTDASAITTTTLLSDYNILYDIFLCATPSPTWSGPFSRSILLNLFISTSTRYKAVFDRIESRETKIKDTCDIRFGVIFLYILVQNGIIAPPFRFIPRQLLASIYVNDDLPSFQFFIENVDEQTLAKETIHHDGRLIDDLPFPCYNFSIGPRIFHFLLEKKILTPKILISIAERFWVQFIYLQDVYYPPSAEHNLNTMALTLLEMENPSFGDESSGSPSISNSKFPFSQLFIEKTRKGPASQSGGSFRDAFKSNHGALHTLYRHIYSKDPDLMIETMNTLAMVAYDPNGERFTKQLKFLFSSCPYPLLSSTTAATVGASETSDNIQFQSQLTHRESSDHQTTVQYTITPAPVQLLISINSLSDGLGLGVFPVLNNVLTPLSSIDSASHPMGMVSFFVRIKTLPFLFSILSRGTGAQSNPLQFSLSRSNRNQQRQFNINVNMIVDVHWVNESSVDHDRFSLCGFSTCAFAVLAKGLDFPIEQKSNRYGPPLYIPHPLEIIIGAYIEALVDGIEEELYPREKSEIVLAYNGKELMNA